MDNDVMPPVELDGTIDMVEDRIEASIWSDPANVISSAVAQMYEVPCDTIQ